MTFIMHRWRAKGVYERKPLSWIPTILKANRVVYCGICGEKIEVGKEYHSGRDTKGYTSKIACSDSCRKEWDKN